MSYLRELLEYKIMGTCVVVDDRVGDKSRALVPDLLRRFGFHSELAGVDIRDRAPHAVVSLTTIERFLYALPKF